MDQTDIEFWNGPGGEFSFRFGDEKRRVAELELGTPAQMCELRALSVDGNLFFVSFNFLFGFFFAVRTRVTLVLRPKSSGKFKIKQPRYDLMRCTA